MHVDSRGRLPQNVVFLLILLVVERLFRQSEADASASAFHYLCNSPL